MTSSSKAKQLSHVLTAAASRSGLEMGSCGGITIASDCHSIVDHSEQAGESSIVVLLMRQRAMHISQGLEAMATAAYASNLTPKVEPQMPIN